MTLGQNKYVSAFHDQLDHLLVKHKYSHFVEALYNCMVQTHSSDYGKHAVVQDKFLELMKCLFAHFPKVRTLQAMLCLGDCIGPTQRCKRISQKFYEAGDHQHKNCYSSRFEG